MRILNKTELAEIAGGNYYCGYMDNSDEFQAWYFSLSDEDRATHDQCYQDGQAAGDRYTDFTDPRGGMPGGGGDDWTNWDGGW